MQVDIKVISRNEQEYTKERKVDTLRYHKNVNPALHPFEKPREYTRALNAVKLDRVFARPFIGALDGHADSVYRILFHPTRLSTLISGGCDGEIRIWNLSTHKTLLTVPAHNSFVRGLAVEPSGNTYFSCGSDKKIKQWIFPSIDDSSLSSSTYAPIRTWLGEYAFNYLDHNIKGNYFATAGAKIDIWNHERSEPVSTFSWGSDSISTVKWNPVETDLIVSAASDRNVVLYDTRGGSPVKKLFLKMCSNAVAWNPMEVYYFTLANEDNNCYTFDMRFLNAARTVHTGHVSAVMDVNYSPTGEEFVTGSYDRSIRIFEKGNYQSREIYHTKRMQRVYCVKYSADAKYVVSGSDDTNIRIWKADASMPLKVMHHREEEKLEYSRKLLDRYKHMPQIKRIKNHRHLPRPIYGATKLRGVVKRAETNRLERIKKNTKNPPAAPDSRKDSIVNIVD